MDWVKVKEGVIEKVILGFISACVFTFTVYVFSEFYKASKTLQETNVLINTQVTEINEAFKKFNDMQIKWNNTQEQVLKKHSSQLNALLSGGAVEDTPYIDSGILVEQRQVQQSLKTHFKGDL